MTAWRETETFQDKCSHIIFAQRDNRRNSARFIRCSDKFIFKMQRNGKYDHFFHRSISASLCAVEFFFSFIFFANERNSKTMKSVWTKKRSSARTKIFFYVQSVVITSHLVTVTLKPKHKKKRKKKCNCGFLFVCRQSEKTNADYLLRPLKRNHRPHHLRWTATNNWRKLRPRIILRVRLRLFVFLTMPKTYRDFNYFLDRRPFRMFCRAFGRRHTRTDDMKSPKPNVGNVFVSL